MRLAVALTLLSCLLLSACSGSNGGASSGGGAPGGGKTLEQLWRSGGDDVAVVPGTDHYAVGDVRASFLVVDSTGRPVILPSARVWVARSLKARPFLESSAKLERIGIPGGDEADSTHIYVAHFRARAPGTYWLVAEPEGGKETVHALDQVEVLAKDTVPGIGDPAPASSTPTLASARGNASRLTTRVPPDTTLLHYSVASSLHAHVPFVVTFATPKFCSSRTCGPVVDVVEEVAHKLQGQHVRFIHVEVYEDNDPERGYNRWMRAWHLETEPWTFVVNRRGKIAGRFQGTVSVAELEQAMQAVAS